MTNRAAPRDPRYILVQVDRHPAAIANGNLIRRSPVGESGLNYWPFITRANAEHAANALNRLADEYCHTYVEVLP